MEDIGHIGPIVVPEGADEFLPSRPNAVSTAEIEEIWNQAYKRHEELVAEDEKQPANKRLGIAEVGCAVFVACLLHAYLRTPINYRFIKRGMEANVGTPWKIITQMLKNANIKYQEHSFEFPDLADSKQAVLATMKYIIERGNCAILSTFMLDEEGNAINAHVVAMIPSDTISPWVTDCSGDYTDEFLKKETHSNYIIEITSDRLPLPPRELRGGRKKTKRNHRRSKKTRSRK